MHVERHSTEEKECEQRTLYSKRTKKNGKQR
jgi:hypothetical protein